MQRSRNVVQQPALGKRFALGPELQPDGVRDAVGIAHENPSVGSQVLDGPGRARRAGRSDVDGLAAGPTDPFDDRRDDRRRCQAAVAGDDRRRLAFPIVGPADSPGELDRDPPRQAGLRSLIATLPTPSA